MEMKPMNKYEFLSRLRGALSSLSKEEREAAMSYYEEFFSDAGEENEQAVIASLGTPEELARSIINENAKDETTASESGNAAQRSGFVPPPTPAQTARRWTGGQIALIVILAVFASPVWFGLLGGIFGIIVCLFGIAIGLFGGICASAVAFFISGIVSLFSEPVVGIFLLGIALILCGLVPLAIYPLCKCIIRLIAAIVRGIGSLFNRIFGRRENIQ